MDESIREQLDWLSGILPAPSARVLDAGCGAGELAGALADTGYEVVAIDADPAAVERARANGVPARHADLTEFAADPFDAVLFSFSLHHIHPLDKAVARAAALLRGSGVLVADEFAWERADRAAAAWFRETEGLLAAAGLVDRDHEHEHDHEPAAADADPLDAWRARHDDHHTGEVMLARLRARFATVEVTARPYLARYLGGLLAPGAGPVAGELRRIERRRVAAGELPPTGCRIVARSPYRRPA